jgi:hypothetical protein
VDVLADKRKLKVAELKDRNLPLAKIIAHLLIEKEEQKIISRAKYRK